MITSILICLVFMGEPEAQPETAPQDGYNKIFPLVKEDAKDIRHVVNDDGEARWPNLYKARKGFRGLVNGGVSFITNGLMLPEKIMQIVETIAVGLFILLPVCCLLYLMSPKKEKT